jgi:hypothetical protein
MDPDEARQQPTQSGAGGRNGLLPGSRRVGADRAMDNEIVKRLMWTGLVAGTGALASVVAMRVSAFIWQRVFGEDPPD